MTVNVEYLLPCECGNRVRVSRSQAGQMVPCPCGRTLLVPTLIELRSLESVESENESIPAKKPWGSRQRVLFVGLVVIAISTGFLAYFYYARPLPPPKSLDLAVIQRGIGKLSLLDTYRVWESLQEGPSQKSPADRDYEELYGAYQRRMAITGVFLGFGLLTFLGGFRIRPSA